MGRGLLTPRASRALKTCWRVGEEMVFSTKAEGGPGNQETQGCSGHPGRSDALVALVSYRRNPCLRGVFLLQSACIYGGFALILKISIKIKKRQSSKVPPPLHRHNCGKTAKKKEGGYFFSLSNFLAKLYWSCGRFLQKVKVEFC